MTIVPTGATIGKHTHANNNEAIYVVVSGNGEMEADGERIEVEVPTADARTTRQEYGGS